MPLDEITDAAQLAAQAPAGGVLSPRDAEIGVAWLDLRGSGISVSISRIATVTRTLGPCLSLLDSANLVISSSEVPLRSVAKVAAYTLRSVGLGDLSIATIRGESLVRRLEEFLVAGCEFRDSDSPGETLRDRLGEASEAFAIPPSSMLTDAFGAGASIVVAGGADRTTLAELADPPSSTREVGEVELWLHTGYRLTTVLIEDHRKVKELLVSVPAVKECHVETVALGDRTAITLTAKTKDPIKDACCRLDLVVEGLAQPLEESIRSIYEKRRTCVPADLLEFDYDLRQANAWMDESASKHL